MLLCGEIYIYIYINFSDNIEKRDDAQSVRIKHILIILHYYLATERLPAEQTPIIT